MIDADGTRSMILFCGFTPIVFEECVRCGGFKTSIEK
jgi:hypothetical protein